MTSHTSTPLFDEQPYERSFKATIIEKCDNLLGFDRTLFYPVGGGQQGDVGYLTQTNGNRTRIVDTFRDDTNRSLIWHRLGEGHEGLRVGDAIVAELDWSARYLNMKMHTCLHLLCSLIDAPVTGCSIGQGKGRLDFDLPETTLTKEQITESLNALIADRIEVETRLISPNEYDTALALVRNRYALPPRSANAVKMIEVRGIDIQPCGGTHVRNTAEIDRVVCEKIEKKGRQNRRIGLRFVD
ncbi:alanyl-tRNA editing protein [Paraburkholderia rhizosphaerae]|uniref:Alanine--tRNA ligase n=1 Tax=Paraburkholderia rhizosphaerae TaxID=480658 RepID=A0A4R8LYF9_9BURK|nr:alanyl-tRNA editing protein [Paraburkholderia rhizosphaerae]TDY53394.1 Ala-tRNA(Pro) hydrolase [Paraburkholderia rhizosphaerae]